MKRYALTPLALILVFSLMLLSMPTVSAAATYNARVSMKQLIAGNLLTQEGPNTLTRQVGAAKKIAAPSGKKAMRYTTVSINVKVAPATQKALEDLNVAYNASKLKFQTASYSVEKSHLTVRLNFSADGAPCNTSVKFFSGSKKSVKDATKVKIQPIPVAGVTLNAYNASLKTKDTLQLSATLLPGNASNKKVRWTTTNKKIATVNAAGKVTAVGPGTALIKATSVSGAKRASCRVTVTKPTPTPKATPKPTAPPNAVPAAATPKPAATPTPAPAAEKKDTVYRALLIGNEAYSTRLRGPYNDLIAMNAVFTRSTLGGKAYNVTTLKDRKKAEILSSIAALAKNADKDDVTLFYYSGHGAQASKTESGTGLVGVDNKLLTVTELKAALDKIPGTVVVILDSCFAGMFIGKGASASGKSFDDAVMNAFASPLKAKGLTSNQYHVITACRKAETSVSVGYYYNGAATYVGLATYYLALAGGYDLFEPANTTFHGDNAPKDKVATFGEVFAFADANVDEFVMSCNSPSLTQDMQCHSSDVSFPLFGRT